MIYYCLQNSDYPGSVIWTKSEYMMREYLTQEWIVNIENIQDEDLFTVEALNDKEFFNSDILKKKLKHKWDSANFDYGNELETMSCIDGTSFVISTNQLDGYDYLPYTLGDICTIMAKSIKFVEYMTEYMQSNMKRDMDVFMYLFEYYLTRTHIAADNWCDIVPGEIMYRLKLYDVESYKRYNINPIDCLEELESDGIDIMSIVDDMKLYYYSMTESAPESNIRRHKKMYNNNSMNPIMKLLSEDVKYSIETLIKYSKIIIPADEIDEKAFQIGTDMLECIARDINNPRELDSIFDMEKIQDNLNKIHNDLQAIDNANMPKVLEDIASKFVDLNMFDDQYHELNKGDNK